MTKDRKRGNDKGRKAIDTENERIHKENLETYFEYESLNRDKL